MEPEAEPAAVVAWNRCSEILATTNAHHYLSRKESNRLIVGDPHASKWVAHAFAFTQALAGLDVDVSVNGVPFFFWAVNTGRNEAGLEVILRNVKDLYARDPESGACIAHCMFSYRAGILRMQAMDREALRTLLTFREPHGHPLINAARIRRTHVNAIFTCVRSAGIDLFATHPPGMRMAIMRFIARFAELGRREKKQCKDVYARCKILVFARERHLVERDGDNAILHRIGGFLFHT